MLEAKVYQEPGVTPVEDEPQIEIEESGDNYARIVASPLSPGSGITQGNALRRVLLSALPGAAVVSVRIDGVQHEFSTITSVKEDTIEFLLNVKEIRLRALSDRPGTLILDVGGREGVVTAGDIQVPEHYEIVNPEQYLALLDSPKGRLQVEFNVAPGRGYVPAGQGEDVPIGVIPVDAIFSPVRKVNYRVEQTRVGQATNYDKLTLEVWTDGTTTGVDAISRSADLLVDQFELFSNMGRPALPTVERGLGAGVVLTPERYNMPIEDLQLSMRAFNCLRRSGLMTVGNVLEKSEEELLALRNFGRKSYDELRDKLDELDLLPPETEEELMEAPPLDEAEMPISAHPVTEAEEPKAGPEVAAETEDRTEAIVPAQVESPPKKSKKKKKAPSADAGEEGDEEMPEWKRKLAELTGDSTGEEKE
jgi:DNA-directed RNA polymerase subunit alpha